MYYDQFPKLHSHQFDCVDNCQFEEVAELNELQPTQVLKAKG